MQHLPVHDPEVERIIRHEESRIEDTLDLIAAENHAPRSILEAVSSMVGAVCVPLRGIVWQKPG